MKRVGIASQFLGPIPKINRFALICFVTFYFHSEAASNLLSTWPLTASTPLIPNGDRIEFEQYLKKKLDLNSHNLNQLLESSQDVIGIEIIIADRTEDQMMSRWGHAMLRFVNRTPQWDDDFVLSFVALIDHPQISYRKGLLGGYDVLGEIDTLGNYWKHYVRTQQRPLNRYIIPTLPEQRHSLIAFLGHWSHDRSLRGSYTFLSNNCAGALTQFLMQTGVTPKGRRETIPTEIPDWTELRLLTPFPALRIENRAPIIEMARRILGFHDDPPFDSSDDFFFGKNWPEDSIERLENGLSPIEIRFLLSEVPLAPIKVQQALGKKYSHQNGGPTLNDVLGYTPVPEALYQICKSKTCARELKTIEDSLVESLQQNEWNNLTSWRLQRWKKAQRPQYRNVQGPKGSHRLVRLPSMLSRIRPSNPELISHWEFLLIED